jgi:tetratricopeptide (TPR) repeat protein
LNGHLVTRELPLYHGDKIEIGSSTFTVEILKEDGKALRRPFIDTRFEETQTSVRKIMSRPLFITVGLSMALIVSLIFFFTTSEKDRGQIEPYWSAARNYYDRGLYNDALVELEVALAVEPRNQEVIKLIEDTRSKLRIDKSFKEAVALAQSENIRELEGAIHKFDEVLRLNPNHQEAIKFRAEIEEKLQTLQLLSEAKRDFSTGSYEESIEKINAVLEKFPDNKVALSYAELLQQYNQLRRKKEQARAMAKEVRLKQENRPPEIARVIVQKSTLSAGGHTQITAVASDPDNEILRFQWSALHGTVEGLEDEVTYVAPEQVPETQSDEVMLLVNDESGSTTSRRIYLTINPAKPKVFLTEAQKLEAKKLFIEGYRSEKEPTIRNIPRAIAYYKKVLEIAPDPDYLYYQKALSRLSKLEFQEKG